MRPLATKTPFFKRFRFVYRHSSLLLKCAVLAAIVVSIGALTMIRLNIEKTKDHKESLRTQAAQVERDNAHTEQLIKQKDTVEGNKNIAAEVLGLVDPNTVYYQVKNQD